MNRIELVTERNTGARRIVVNGFAFHQVLDYRVEPAVDHPDCPTDNITLTIHGKFESRMMDKLPRATDMSEYRNVQYVLNAHMGFTDGAPFLTVVDRATRQVRCLTSVKNALFNIIGAPADRYMEETVSIARNLLCLIDNSTQD